MKEKLYHIMNTSASLLGFSLVALTTIRSLNYQSQSFIDLFAATQVLLFGLSTAFSFFSIKAQEIRASKRLELSGEFFFMIGLLILVVNVLYIAVKLR